LCLGVASRSQSLSLLSAQRTAHRLSSISTVKRLHSVLIKINCIFFKIVKPQINTINLNQFLVQGLFLLGSPRKYDHSKFKITIPQVPHNYNKVRDH